MSTASFLHSSFLRAIIAVMACPCSESSSSPGAPLPCQAADQMCDICCACQSICPFIPTDSGVPRTVDPQKSVYLAVCLPFFFSSLCLQTKNKNKKTKKQNKTKQNKPKTNKQTNKQKKKNARGLRGTYHEVKVSSKRLDHNYVYNGLHQRP